MEKGTLYLIPVPLSSEAEQASLTPFLKETINQIQEYIVENEKSARRFLKTAGLKIPQNRLRIHDYGKHKRETIDYKAVFKGLLSGEDAGLLSEAGCPAVADPGAAVVAQAHQLGVPVRPLVGPSSIMLGLMASGFNGQSFTFHGYLPIPKGERSRKVKQIEQDAKRHKQTQIFIETPFRNHALLDELLKTCQDTTRLCVACDLTGKEEWIHTETIKTWKKTKVNIHKRPAIFLLY